MSSVAKDFIFNNKLNEKRGEQDKAFISDITIERVNRAGEKILKEINLLNLDVGYKVFSLVEKPQLKKEGELDNITIAQNRTTLDKLYNMLTAKHNELTTEIKEIEKDKLYQIEKDYYVLDNCNIENITDLDSYVLVDGYAIISTELLENIKCKLKVREQIEVLY